MKNKPTNVGIYVRVSTEQQVREGYSIEAQKEILVNFALEQKWNIYDIYADCGVSAKNINNRPELNRLINDIKSRDIDIVLLYKFDRLTRDARDTEDIMSIIEEYGIQVITLSGGLIDVSNATGRFMVRINGAQAQFEREQIIERVKMGLRQKVKQGYTLACATTCYGYDRKIHEKEQIINDAEAVVVKKIFNLYSDGKTLTQICDILNTEGVPTKMAGKRLKRKGVDEYYIVQSCWRTKTIREILSNPTYIGKVRYHIGKIDNMVEEGRHDSIISQELWQDVQNKLQKNKRAAKTNIPKEDVYFCGSLFCGVCGAKMTTSRTVKRKKDGTKVIFRSYVCPNKEKKICQNSGISHLKMEKAFCNYLETIEDLNTDLLKNISNDVVNTNNDIYQKNLTILKNKKRDVINSYIASSLSVDQLNDIISEIDKKIKFFNEELIKSSKLQGCHLNEKNISKKLKQHWLLLSNSEKKNFLLNFVDKIMVINNKLELPILTITFEN